MPPALGRYDLLKALGQGAMGEVWLAEDRETKQVYAIKTMRSGLGDPKTRALFVDEARIAARIVHRNVARVIDAGEDAGRPYLVLERVDGPSLRDLLRRRSEPREAALPVGIAVRIVADACAGLEAAHELTGQNGVPLGLVHRDISPQNILVSKEGITKVIDFGEVKARERSAGDTTTAVIKGNVRYMAPEQALGDPIDRRSDIHALGAVLFHALVGRPPIDGADDVTVLRGLLAMSPLLCPPEVPNEIAAILVCATHPEIEERYASAGLLREALEAAAASLQAKATEADVAAFVAARMGLSSAGNERPGR